MKAFVARKGEAVRHCRRLRSVLLVLAAMSAATVSKSAIASESKKMFVARHVCAVMDRLLSIRESGDPTTSNNRFIVVALAESPDRFVQCIFHDNDRKLYCEAVSGYFARKGGRRPIEFDAAALAALANFGFSTDESEGNFVLRIERIPSRLDDVAELLLSVLHDVYGARAQSSVELVAPLAPLASGRCQPTS